MEKDIERYFYNAVKKSGWLALKFVSPNFTGVPDRLILKGNGEMFFAEFKSDKGKLSERQKFVIKQFEAMGFRCYIINSKETAICCINQESIKSTQQNK